MNPASKHTDDIKRILAAIVQLAGGELVNKTLLFKAYYYAHLFYWKDANGLLTRSHRIVRMPNGPGIASHERLLKEMVSEGLIEVDVKPWGDKAKQFTFRTARGVVVSSEEGDSIQKALRLVRGKGAGTVSDESHEFSRSWRSSANGDPMNIYSDLLTPESAAQVEQLVNEARAELGSILG